MANPQKEDGYTAIANELMDALAKIRISGEARQVLDVIFRKTYGYNKKEDMISLSQFSAATGISKSHIIRATKKLTEMNIIISKKGNRQIVKYRINKNFELWNPLPKKETSKSLPKKEITFAKKGNFRCQKRDPQKQVSKDNITKPNTCTVDVVSEYQDFIIEFRRNFDETNTLLEDKINEIFYPKKCNEWCGYFNRLWKDILTNHVLKRMIYEKSKTKIRDPVKYLVIGINGRRGKEPYLIIFPGSEKFKKRE